MVIARYENDCQSELRKNEALGVERARGGSQNVWDASDVKGFALIMLRKLIHLQLRYLRHLSLTYLSILTRNGALKQPIHLTWHHEKIYNLASHPLGGLRQPEHLQCTR